MSKKIVYAWVIQNLVEFPKVELPEEKQNELAKLRDELLSHLVYDANQRGQLKSLSEGERSKKEVENAIMDIYAGIPPASMTRALDMLTQDINAINLAINRVKAPSAHRPAASAGRY